MWRSTLDGNPYPPPTHPYENGNYWEYVTTTWWNKGTFIPFTIYYRNEVVDYLGSSYVCVTDSTIYAPGVNNDWDLIASKGDQGIQGTQGIIWTGTWHPNTTYEIDDAVYHSTGKSYICIQSHLGIDQEPDSSLPDWEDYWDILANVGDVGPASTLQGPIGGAIGNGYSYDVLVYTGGDDADGSCRFDVIATNLTLATKCWLSNTDNDGNDISPYMLSFEDTTSAVKCYLTVAKYGDNSEFMTWTVDSITSDAGGWKELSLIEAKSYSSVDPFPFVIPYPLVNISMNRTGDRGTNWKGDWSSSTAYLLSDAVMQDGSTWISIQAGTNQLPYYDIISPSPYWDLMALGGATTGAGSVGAGYLFDTGNSNTPSSGEVRFNTGLANIATFVYINEEDIEGENNEKLFEDWLGGSDSKVKGYIKITSANDNTRWWGAEVISLATPSATVHSLGLQNIITTLPIQTTFIDEEKLIVSLARTGDAGLNWRQGYSVSSSYEIDDSVYYKGRAHVCIQAHTPVHYPDSNPLNLFWNILVPGFESRGVWSSLIEDYHVNDIVNYQGSSYIRISDAYSTANPVTGVNFWDLMVSKGDDGSDADMPIGSIIMWAGAAAPDDSWLLCDGTTYAVSGQYTPLYDLIGYTYGGISPGNFGVPDMRSRFVAGRDVGDVNDDWATNLGDTGGESMVELGDGQMPSHTHGVLVDFEQSSGGGGGLSTNWQRFFEDTRPDTLPPHTPDLTERGDNWFRDLVSSLYNWEPVYSTAYDNSLDGSGSPDSPPYIEEIGGTEGEDLEHENKPPFVIVNYIIKAKLN